MANRIFISYSSEEPELIADLVNFLSSEGYMVWWDRQLAPGDNYRAEIEKEIAVADAVFVIWSERSIKSSWVIDEADRALHHHKLIPLRTRDLNPLSIPLKFGSLHAGTIDDHSQILIAVRKLLSDATPNRDSHNGSSSARVVSPQLSALAEREWPEACESRDPKRLERFEQYFAGTFHAREARALREDIDAEILAAQRREEALQAAEMARIAEAKHKRMLYEARRAEIERQERARALERTEQSRQETERWWRQEKAEEKKQNEELATARKATVEAGLIDSSIFSKLDTICIGLNSRFPGHDKINQLLRQIGIAPDIMSHFVPREWVISVARDTNVKLAQYVISACVEAGNNTLRLRIGEKQSSDVTIGVANTDEPFLYISDPIPLLKNGLDLTEFHTLILQTPNWQSAKSYPSVKKLKSFLRSSTESYYTQLARDMIMRKIITNYANTFLFDGLSLAIFMSFVMPSRWNWIPLPQKSQGNLVNGWVTGTLLVAGVGSLVEWIHLRTLRASLIMVYLVASSIIIIILDWLLVDISDFKFRFWSWLLFLVFFLANLVLLVALPDRANPEPAHRVLFIVASAPGVFRRLALSSFASVYRSLQRLLLSSR